MADESQEARSGTDAHEIRHVNWREVFGFTQIFKGFKLSRHMTKIVIALAAVILTWGLGQVLDLVFTPLSAVYVDPENNMSEPDAYWCVADFGGWQKKAEKDVEAGLVKAASAELVGKDLDYETSAKAEEAAKKEARKVRSQLYERLEKSLKKDVDKIEADRKDAIKKAEDEKDSEKRDEQKDAINKGALNATRARYKAGADADAQMQLLGKQGPFDTFVTYERHYFRQAVGAILHGNVFTGFATVRAQRQQVQQGVPPFAGRLQAGQPGQDPLGLLASLALMGYGIIWLAATHWVYAILLFVPMLLIWSVAGGAIARAAALQATRDEKAGITECVKFGLKKVLSFLASPLVPVVVFLVVGLLTALVVGLAGTIPGFGGIWLGITFGLALIGGVIMAFLLIGLLAGGLLMAPTIAVEGSDTFDACTRSYQFVLARPWRAGIYG
ncbi:MAG: hypothetical protein PHU85_16990, partial [Phycisphaerae bacterium]|nr:hypothetical protein [Phycisphaerae bacterium]